MDDDILIEAQGVAKKFCRSLKRSLLYGVQDTLRDLSGRPGLDKLRPGEFWALQDISFKLRRGECLGLIGRNGAGKTTLLKMLSGLIKPDKGRIEMRGRVGALIALGAGFNPILTGRENIYVNASVLGLSKREITQKIDGIIDFADIGEFIDTPVQNYSSGMAVRLGFAVAAAVEPDILLLDEVLAVGDSRFQAKCFNVLSAFRERGTGFIFVSHNMHMITRHCQNVMYVRDGNVVYLGNVENGAAKFLSDMEVAGSKDVSEETNWDETLGSGKIKFVSARFLDSRNQQIEEINVGDPVILALRYRTSGNVLEGLILDVVIRDRDEVIYQGTSPLSGGPASNIGELRIKFDYLPVNANYLDFSFAFLDRVTKEVHDWKRNFRLNVRRKSDSSGILVLPTSWTIEPQ